MAIFNREYEPIGWGVFWQETDQEHSILRPTENEARKYAYDKVLVTAVIEQVFRKRPRRAPSVIGDKGDSK